MENKTMIAIAGLDKDLFDAKQSGIHYLTGVKLIDTEVLRYLIYVSEELPINIVILDKILGERVINGNNE